MRRRLLVLAAVVLAVAIAIWATAGPPKPQPTPPGTFAFAALGDAPYMPWEILQYRLVVAELDAHDLAFVAHVGDIFWRPCSDEHYREVRARFDAMRHPLFYTPGDNEWADCWEDGAGSFEPLERLDRLRAIFFDDPSRSLGREKLPAESQGGAFRENVRWGHDGVVFATVHVVGSDNAGAQFPGRRKADNAAVTERTEAASAWMRETFAAARASGAPAVVLFFHAHPYRRPAWEPFVSTLEEEARRFAGPVLVVHGDGHEYYVDRPFRAKNITRVQVPGSPRVGWVRIVVDVKARDPFSFDEHVVPRWKYW